MVTEPEAPKFGSNDRKRRNDRNRRNDRKPRQQQVEAAPKAETDANEGGNN